MLLKSILLVRRSKQTLDFEIATAAQDNALIVPFARATVSNEPGGLNLRELLFAVGFHPKKHFLHKFDIFDAFENPIGTLGNRLSPFDHFQRKSFKRLPFGNPLSSL